MDKGGLVRVWTFEGVGLEATLLYECCSDGCML